MTTDCCGGEPLHSITCPVIGRGQPHAMVTATGELWFPDNDGDAAHFAREFGARPVNPDRWPLNPIKTRRWWRPWQR